MNANRLILDAGQVAPMIAGVVAPMRVQDVVGYLGVSDVPALVSGGILTPIPVSGRKVGKHEFARADVEGLMADLHRDAEPLDAVGPDQVDLVAACRATARRMSELVRMIREGRVTRVWRLGHGQGLRSVVVSRSEMKALTRRPDQNDLAIHSVIASGNEMKAPTRRPDHDDLPIHQVIRRLRVHHAAIDKLLAKRALRSTKRPSPRGGRPSRYVTEADLAEFQRRYVTLTEMARTRCMGIRGVKTDLVARGIEPVLRPEVYETAFYLRSEI